MAFILIADDDELVAEKASDVLIDAGHGCGWVTDGQKAIDLIKWRRPGLLLLDNDMPVVSGPQVLRQLRMSPEFYDLPVIMFTRVSGGQDEEQALYNGAQDYIRKPFDPKFLLYRVNAALRTHAERPAHIALETMLARAAGMAGYGEGAVRRV